MIPGNEQCVRRLRSLGIAVADFVRQAPNRSLRNPRYPVKLRITRELERLREREDYRFIRERT